MNRGSWKRRLGVILCARALLFSTLIASAYGQGAASPASPSQNLKAETHAQATLDPTDLLEFRDQPPAVQTLLTDALTLTTQGLSYKYGSDDPRNGGMDCSGTVHYLLGKEGVAGVPRQASDLYAWVRRLGLFQAVVSTTPSTFELDALKPGDLLFWTGTYDVVRDPPVTHVMIYLGTTGAKGGKPKRVMFGASEGRHYGGAPRYGVSVFDFDIPVPHGTSTARFIGYAPIPGLPKPAPLSVSAPAPVPQPTSPGPEEMLPPPPEPAPTTPN